ncbi:MAG TPA: hypothetical protein VK537_07955, partial [Galbitalea sp.]|nr:hypothetical protein [Galbitalea sp.]
HDPAEASLHIAQFAVVDLALLSDAVADPPVVLETDHEASMVVSQDVVTGRASRARWACAWGGRKGVPNGGRSLDESTGVLPSEVPWGWAT